MKFYALMLVLGSSLFSPMLYAASTTRCKGPKPPKENAQCLAERYKSLLKNHPDAFDSTRQLIKEGDRLFAKKNYAEAYANYDEARINSPNVYAQIRLAQSHAMIWLNTTEWRDNDQKSTGSCFLPKALVKAVDGVITDEFGTALELAKLLRTQPPASAAMLTDTARKYHCLQNLADQYRAVQTGCVDLSRLRNCITNPK